MGDDLLSLEVYHRCIWQEDYRPLAEACKALEPLPPEDEIVGAVRAGRRPIDWEKLSEGREEA